jgi:tRNA(fMet)-specific endonuclease VapC
MEIIILDTDFLFEYFNKNEDAIQAIDKNKKDFFAISFTTHAEILKTASSLEILKSLNGKLKKVDFLTIQLDEDISKLTLELIQKYHLSHSLSIPDALQAATALKYNCTFATCNQKHFKQITGLKLLPHSVVPKAGFLS